MSWELIAKLFMGGIIAGAGALAAVAILLAAARRVKAARTRRRGWTAADEVLFRFDAAAALAELERADWDRRYAENREVLSPSVLDTTNRRTAR